MGRQTMPETPVLEAIELTKVYHMPRKGSNSWRQQEFRAVDTVSLQLFAGTTAALVGQSGSGKSTLVRLLSRLERPTSGVIRVDGEVTDARRGRSYRQYCEQVQIVLQDPYASLNPGFRVGRWAGACAGRLRSKRSTATARSAMPRSKGCWSRSS